MKFGRMAKIISYGLILVCVLVGCEKSIEKKSFQEYVDYSGMLMTSLKNVYLPDSLMFLNLGALCYDIHTGKRYEKYGELDTNLRNGYHRAKEYRNYFESVPEEIKKIDVDSLLLNTNEIQNVPEWLFRKKMKYLDLSSNKILDFSIPKDCLVESINLRENLLKELPKGIFDCKVLKTIYLDKSLKKHSVKSDTILVYGKKIVFGMGFGDVADINELIERMQKNQYPKAVQLNEW